MNDISRFGLLGVCWLTFLCILALLYTTIPPSPDQSQFDWMAFLATQGRPYYTDSFDMNWPGAMLLHEAGLRLFGVHAWTWRLTDFLLLTGFTIAGSVFLSKAHWPLAAVLFLFLYPALYVTAGGWMAGQRDIIAAGFLMTSCAMAMLGGRREALAIFLAGACVAAAVLIRPTYLSFLAGLMFLELMPLKLQQVRMCRPLVRLMRIALGFLAVIGAVVVAGLIQGNLDDWYQQSIQFSTSVYISEPPQDWRETLRGLFLRSWHWISFLALFGILVWLRRDGLGYAVLLVLGVVATCALSFVVQDKGFSYHLSGVLIVIVLLMTITIDELDQWRRESSVGVTRFTATFALSLVSLLVIVGAAKKLANLSEGAAGLLVGQFGPTSGYGLTEDERRKIVEIIQSGSTPDQTIAIYGTNYDLPYRAQRMPTYRFFTPAADQITPNFVHHYDWIAEIDAALEARPPAFIIIDRSMITGAIEKPNPSNQDLAILPRLLRIMISYKVVFVNDDVVVYGPKAS